MKTLRYTVPLVLLFGSACSSQPSPPTSTTRDSAGVAIVENLAPAWGENRGWRAGERLLEIGAIDGPPEYQLFRVNGAVRSADGSIVVANGGTQELRFYDETGVFIRSAGRQGEGPGEFAGSFRLMRMRGDTLLAWDFNLDRLSVFGPAGDFVRSARLGDGSTTLFVDGAFENGDLAAGTAGVFGPGMTDGYGRRTKQFIRYDSAGDSLNSLGEFPDSEWFVKSFGGGRMVASTLVLGKATVTAVAGDLLFVGTGDDYSIDVVSSSGATLRMIRRVHTPVVVTGAVFRDEIENRLAEIPEEYRAGQRDVLEAMPHPEELPPYERLLVDSEGDLWVREYRLTGSTANDWSLFDTRGVWLGDVALPAGVVPFEIGRDYILGKVTDDLDVEHVVLYELLKT